MALVACDIGDLVELSAAFVNAAGVATDPTSVSLRIIKPDGTEVSPAPTPTHGGTGAYTYDLAITASGVWKYRFAGTGAVVAAEEAKVFVRPSSFA